VLPNVSGDLIEQGVPPDGAEEIARQEIELTPEDETLPKKSGSTET
jgi:hypothetical protein